MVAEGLAQLAVDAEQFRMLIEHWPEPAWQWRLEDNSAYWNPAWLTVFGIDPSAETPSYENWIKRVHPDDRQRVESSFGAVFRNSAVKWTDEYRFRRGDGSYATIVDNALIHRGADGKPIQMFGVMVDVSAVRGESEQRRRLAAIIESTTDFVGTGTPDGRIEFVNRAGRRMLDLPETGDLPDLTYVDLCPPEQLESTKEKLEAAARDGVFVGEVTLLARSGRRIPTSAVIIAHRDGEGAVRAISAVMRDLTPIRQLEAQLAQVQRMEAVGRLAGGVAHDFNNILTAIVASAEILVGDDTLSPEQREEVRSIRRSADRAAALTRQLLAFGRRQRLLPRVIDVNEALRDMEDFIRSLVGGDVKLVMDLAPDAGRARVDPGQLEHVMMNLVVNAREAMPAGGTLVIATANVGFTEATQRMHPDVRPGPYVMVSVADTGVGIAAEHQEKIFEPFFTTKPTGEGVGLGLSTAYGILKQSGGHLWVESSAGRGSTFKVFLPRVTLAADPRHDYPRPVTEGAGETVLVVEDEDAVRRVAARVLRSRGYRVVTAANAEEAMQVAAAHDGPIDLLLSDVVMPGMSGTVLAERLVAERPGLKVLFMSGYTAEEIGSDVPLLSKPFTPDELLSEVRIALEGQGARE